MNLIFLENFKIRNSPTHPWPAYFEILMTADFLTFASTSITSSLFPNYLLKNLSCFLNIQNVFK